MLAYRRAQRVSISGGGGGKRALWANWGWSGLEKQMKWIGLEWRKGGGIGEKSCPENSLFRKTHMKRISNNKQKHVGEGGKASGGIPLQP